MHPYRELPTQRVAPPAPSEELVIYSALCAIGAIPIASVVLGGGEFGVEATIGLVIALAGFTGVASRVAARRRHR